MEFCKVQREGHCLGKHELLSHNEIKEDKKDNSNDGFATFADFDNVTLPSDVVPETGLHTKTCLSSRKCITGPLKANTVLLMPSEFIFLASQPSQP